MLFSQMQSSVVEPTMHDANDATDAAAYTRQLYTSLGVGLSSTRVRRPMMRYAVFLVVRLSMECVRQESPGSPTTLQIRKEVNALKEAVILKILHLRAPASNSSPGLILTPESRPRGEARLLRRCAVACRRDPRQCPGSPRLQVLSAHDPVEATR